MTAPLGSVTVPRMFPVICCADTLRQASTTNAGTLRTIFMLFSSLSQKAWHSRMIDAVNARDTPVDMDLRDHGTRECAASSKALREFEVLAGNTSSTGPPRFRDSHSCGGLLG